MNKTMIKLDNAAKIYPAAMTKDWNSVYRVSVYMKDDINSASLKQAVSDLAKRFPSFYVQLYKGFFWDYLKGVENFDIVEKDTQCPCRPMPVGNFDKPMFRVLYRENRIAVEFFHSITDGTGATIYLKTLIARYLELQGFTIEKQFGVLDINTPPSESELEDSFQRLYRKDLKSNRKEDDAYQFLPNKKENYLQIKSGIIPIDELKKITKLKYNCTITEYLAGIYALAFIEQYNKDNSKSKKKVVKISIPVNLRPYFGSDTLRNFASFANIDINPKECKTLADAIRIIKQKNSKMITKENLQLNVSTNVAEEKMFVTKIAPNFLKKPFMKIGFHLFGERKYTSVFSNVGLLKVPQSMEPHIDNFEFIIGETLLNRIYASAVGVKNNLTVTLSAVTESTEVQDFFFNTIANDGINFKLKTNKMVIAA
ncbi:MAG: hypothetical protein RSB11_07635 [Oscillospiraceae bacterium]